MIQEEGRESPCEGDWPQWGGMNAETVRRRTGLWVLA